MVSSCTGARFATEGRSSTRPKSCALLTTNRRLEGRADATNEPGSELLHELSVFAPKTSFRAITVPDPIILNAQITPGRVHLTYALRCTLKCDKDAKLAPNSLTWSFLECKASRSLSGLCHSMSRLRFQRRIMLTKSNRHPEKTPPSEKTSCLARTDLVNEDSGS